MSHFENAKASYTKYAFFKTKINFAVFYQCIWIGAPDEHDILPTAKLLGFFKDKVQVFIENYKDLNGEYDLDPLIIEEAKLLWVGKEPPKPNVIS